MGMHVTLLVLLPVFAWLTRWQLGRALSGNTLSWAYTFEWPLFAGYAVYVWWQLVHDRRAGIPDRSAPTGGGEPGGVGRDGSGQLEPGWALSGGRPKNTAIAASSAVEGGRGRGERYQPQTPEEKEALAAYNRYLAELSARSGAGHR